MNHQVSLVDVCWAQLQSEFPVVGDNRMGKFLGTSDYEALIKEPVCKDFWERNATFLMFVLAANDAL